MSAADEVEAAIDKLQDLRRKWLVDPRNQLFVTLHATIEAQLSALEAALFNIGPNPTLLDTGHATVAAVIRLARAINGTVK